MFHQSKIIVWYKVASQKVVLGETLSNDSFDVVSLWRKTPQMEEHSAYQGFQLSLFDDDGREIAHKAVSMDIADEILMGSSAQYV